MTLIYVEDSSAQADTNFVLTSQGGIVEIQGTAEDSPFSEEAFFELLRLAKIGTKQLFSAQDTALTAFRAK